MKSDSLSELAGILARCQTGIAAIIRQPIALPQWADALADLLLELLPQAARSACLLGGEGNVCLSIRPDGEWLSCQQKSLLQSQLYSLNPVAPGVRKLPAEALPGLHGLAAALHENARPSGFLVVGLPVEATIEDRARGEALSTSAAPAVALRWLLAALQREQQELAQFALVGQALTGLGHELNNALNSMMLQTSVVQLRVDPQARQELASIRQHGSQAAGLVRSLQHVVQERREKSYAIDLTSVLTDILEEDAELRRRLSPATGETPVASAPRIHGTRGAVKQLLRILLQGVCAATTATVKAAIGEEEGSAALTLTIADAATDIGTEDELTAADALLWQNLDEVSRYAGQSLLRQFGGTLTVQHANDGTLRLRIVWRPPA